MLKFTSKNHRFFDSIVLYFGSLTSLALGTTLQKIGNLKPLGATDEIILHGKSTVTNVEIMFKPYDILNPIVLGKWPSTIELYDRPLSSEIPERFDKISGTKRFQLLQSQLAFIHYYEKVKANLGDDTQNWPDIWNFGRVVRNSFAHGGKINFTNPRALSVSWKTLTYSPTDNGREIMPKDLTPVELIYLMKEMEVLA